MILFDFFIHWGVHISLGINFELVLSKVLTFVADFETFNRPNLTNFLISFNIIVEAHNCFNFLLETL
jgi:hypothetical protein